MCRRNCQIIGFHNVKIKDEITTMRLIYQDKVTGVYYTEYQNELHPVEKICSFNPYYVLI